MIGWVAKLLGVDENSFLGQALGIASMGLVGYLGYRAIKGLTSPTQAHAETRSAVPSDDNQVGESGTHKVYKTAQGYLRDDGVKVEWNGKSWQPIASAQIQVDPAFLRTPAAGPSASAVADGEAVYHSAFASFQKSKADGTLKTESISSGTWTKKYTTEDGTILLKDTSGNIGTRNAEGLWVVTNPSGEYVTTVGTRPKTGTQ